MEDSSCEEPYACSDGLFAVWLLEACGISALLDFTSALLLRPRINMPAVMPFSCLGMYAAGSHPFPHTFLL